MNIGKSSLVFSRSQCGRKAATTANAKLIAHRRHPAERVLNANNEAQWKHNSNQELPIVSNARSAYISHQR